ncbi:uncharacterized protein [Elaeis guineensis]|uniref:Uncharacterized protein LOC105055587 n=1 Tax=Elaeis guineensis var. tenera TaxID=51953 RepID=A0A6I9S210_ELAGV|nr:uncharacterized protein LOC105055587 [Elaeis guineensis]
MVLLAKFGKALFALFFIISAWEQLGEFGTDGGPAARLVEPKVAFITDRASSTLGVQLPRIEIKGLIAIGIALKGIGGILFAFGSSTGAYLLLLHMGISAPFLHYFDDYDDPDTLQGITLDLAIYGMLFYFVGMDRTMLIQQFRRRSAGLRTM